MHVKRAFNAVLLDCCVLKPDVYVEGKFQGIRQ